MTRFCCYILLLFSCTLSGQLERFRHFTTADGLPENTGQTIIQDREGYIWIGTQNGLARYDGNEFKVYQHEAGNTSSLSNNQIQDLLLDSENYIWVATRNGLNRFDPIQETFESFLPDTNEAFNSNWLSNTIVQDKEGSIWTSSKKGFYQIKDWDSKEIIHYPVSMKKSWTSLAYDSINDIVYGASTDSLISFKDGKAKFINTFHHGFVELFYSSRGLMTATGDGVYLMSDTEWSRPKWLEQTKDLLVLSLYEDKSGYLWLMSNEGLKRFNENGQVQSWEYDPTRNESLSHNLCLSFLEDKGGLFWVGTGQGINVLDPAQDMFLRLNSSTGINFLLPDPHVQCIHFSDSLNLWIGTAKGLLHMRFDKAFNLSEIPIAEWPIVSQKVYSTKSHSSIKSDNINIIYSDTKGTIWVGTDMGHLYQIDPNTNQLSKTATPDGDTQLRSITEWKDQMWIGFGSELYLFDKKTEVFYRPDWLPVIGGTIWLV